MYAKCLCLSVLVALAASGCMSTRIDDAQAHAAVSGAVESARGHLAAGRHPEALMMLRAAARAAPDDTGVRALQDEIPAATRDIADRPLLGSNRRLRPPVQRSVGAHVLLWPIDRVLDLTDIVSFDVAYGPGLFANVHATRALQLGAGFVAKAGLGWHRHRSLGLQVETETGIVLPAIGTQAMAGARMGTSGVLTGSDGMAGLHRPSDDLYSEYRDYWAVGASVTLVALSVSADLHLVQAVDFLTSFVGIDFAHDDFAHTRGLDLQSGDSALLRSLSRIERQRD